MEVAVLWIGLSAAMGVFAHHRWSRNGWGWFALSLAVSPLLGIAFAAALPSINTGPQAKDWQKQAARLKNTATPSKTQKAWPVA